MQIMNIPDTGYQAGERPVPVEVVESVLLLG